MTRAFLVLALVSCGDSGIVPDPTGGGGNPNGTSSTTSTGAGGVGGDGGTTNTGAGGNGATGGTGGTGATGAGGSAPGGGGSGAGGASQGGWESGTRLRVKSLTSADGSKMPVTLYDSMLQIDCAAGRATDNVTRCLPSNAPPVPAGGPTALYADAACTVPAVSTGAPDCSEPFENPKYASSITGDASGCTERNFYALGAEVATVYAFNGPTCGPPLFPPADTSIVRIIGAEVPPSTFVELTAEID